MLGPRTGCRPLSRGDRAARTAGRGRGRSLTSRSSRCAGRCAARDSLLLLLLEVLIQVGSRPGCTCVLKDGWLTESARLW